MLPRLMVNRHFTGRVTVRQGSLFQPMRGGDAKPPCQTLDVLDAVLTKRRGSLPLGSGGVARSIPGSPALPAQGAQRLAQEGSFIVVQAVRWIWLVHAVVLRAARSNGQTDHGAGLELAPQDQAAFAAGPRSSARWGSQRQLSAPLPTTAARTKEASRPLRSLRTLFGADHA